MTYANLAGSSPEETQGYVEALLALLGDRDPFAVQEELVPAVRELVAGLDDAHLRQPEAAGKWSIVEVVQHLTDSEVVFAYRLRTSAAQPGADLPGYDQDRWARELGYRDADLEGSLALLDHLRRANLRLLRSLPEEAWSRWGQHAERGRETLEQLHKLMAAHDLVHRNQLARIRRAVAG